MILEFKQGQNGGSELDFSSVMYLFGVSDAVE
jgi:hypothetical protein